MGSLTNYKVSDHHTSPASFCTYYLHSTLQKTYKFSYVHFASLHIVLSLSHPQYVCQSGIPKPQYFGLVCVHSQRHSQLCWEKHLSHSQRYNRTTIKWGWTANTYLRFRQALFSAGITPSHQETQTAPMHSPTSINACPGPAFGLRSAFLMVWGFSFQPWGNKSTSADLEPLILPGVNGEFPVNSCPQVSLHCSNLLRDFLHESLPPFLLFLPPVSWT